MPTLLVLRHGKSDWTAADGDDRDRPLAPRGRRAATTIGRFLSATGCLPDLVLTSPAVRARDTVDRAMAAGDWECEVRECDPLYGRGVAAVIRELRAVGPAPTVLVAGHEPTWSALVEALTGARVRFPTAALARIEIVGSDWASVAPNRCELEWFVTPRMLDAATGD